MTNEQSKTDILRTQPRPECFLCGNPGRRLYSNLPDRLFGSPGVWNFNICQNLDCNLIWLDPAPMKEDIHKCYESYFTHDTNRKNLKTDRMSFIKRLRLMILSRYQIRHMYLTNESPGRLLEIGCGNGERLALMQARGWKVVGQEVDPKSAAIAKTVYNCEVYLGELQEISFPDNSFDAVTMHHVIEHIYDPIVLFQECYRILRPKGKLVLVTPNAKSLGHKYFQSNWIGLDPPRHLHLFSTKILRELSRKAGFTKCRCWTTVANADLISRESYSLKYGNKPKGVKGIIKRDISALFFKLFESARFLFNNNIGEECVLIAEK